MFSFFITMLVKQVFFLIAYLSNSNSFPKPLTAAEEHKYLDLAAKGDGNAKNVLIERNLRLVVHVAKKYAASRYDQEDLISIGTIGLIKGISNFDKDKGSRLSTYVARCIDNAMYFLVTHITPFVFLQKKIVVIRAF